MNNQLQPLPFFFRDIPAIGKILLTNQMGSFAFLESRSQLESLAKGDTSTFTAERLEELIAKNFLAEPADFSVRKNLIASSVATSLAEAMSGPSLFIIVPTLRCDHNCRYCQVSRVPLNRKGYDLGTERIDKILKIIQASASKNIKIEFQGGEPLVAFEFVRQFVESAEERLGSGVVSFVICSALGPLNDDVISWAKDRNVVFSVSLDGSEAVHTANRPSSYFNSHENTIAGIGWIRRELGAERIDCLSTVTRKTLDDPCGFVRSYFDLGLERIFIRPLSPFGFSARLHSKLAYSPEEYIEFYRQCLDQIIELNEERPFVEETALIHLQRIFRRGYSGYVDLQSPAGYLLGAIVFNYDGNVFGSDEARMLWESTKAPELVLGTIDNNPRDILCNDRAVSLLADTFLCTAPGCDECAYQPYCGADPLHHLSTQGDHVGNKSISFFCQSQRLLFDHLLKLLETRRDARHTFASWLRH